MRWLGIGTRELKDHMSFQASRLPTRSRYFKRRRSDGRGLVLESLEIGGEYRPVISTIEIGAQTDITLVWPVLGVLFERP